MRAGHGCIITLTGATELHCHRASVEVDMIHSADRSGAVRVTRNFRNPFD